MARQPSFAEVVVQQVVILEEALRVLIPSPENQEATAWWKSAYEATNHLDVWARRRGDRNQYEDARRQQRAILAAAIPQQDRRG